MTARPRVWVDDIVDWTPPFFGWRYPIVKDPEGPKSGRELIVECLPERLYAMKTSDGYWLSGSNDSDGLTFTNPSLDVAISALEKGILDEHARALDLIARCQ